MDDAPAARLPVLFVGHGNPMLAITSNPYAEAWDVLGASLPRPRAVLCVSAHWYVRGTGVTAMTAPRTIHDFGGFPAELFAVEYPAPGDPALAVEVHDLLAPLPVILDDGWGLDHGAWSVLRHLFPGADVPVVQLSLDATKPPEFHYELGQRLAPLRDRGVLIVGSGNVVHNLRLFTWDPASPAFDWAARFDAECRRLLDAGDHAPLVDYSALGADAKMAVPTPDHYLPLLYVAGAGAGDPVTYPVVGFDGGSMSMRSVRLG
jgi:4,5-DOPA dioxygenase extradiol